jgi:hypothetical protein
MMYDVPVPLNVHPPTVVPIFAELMAFVSVQVPAVAP